MDDYGSSVSKTSIKVDDEVPRETGRLFALAITSHFSSLQPNHSSFQAYMPMPILFLRKHNLT